jgi:hypothetical protein
MNRAALVVLLGVVVVLCLVQAFAGAQYYQARPAVPPPPNVSPYEQEPAVGPETQPGEPLKPRFNPISDPNKVRATIKGIQGLEQALQDVDRSSRNEVTQWLQEDNVAIEDKVKLLRQVQLQVWDELLLIRKYAEAEKAVKTVAAIDGLLLTREERVDKITKRLQDDLRSGRRTGVGTTGTTRGRTTRTTGRYRTSTSTGTMEQVSPPVEDPTTDRPVRRR